MKNEVNVLERKKTEKYKYLILILILILAFIFSLSLGRYGLSISELVTIFVSKLPGVNISYPEVFDTIIFQVRLPRILVAMIIGASLSISGAAYQAMFKNPMVSPDILGASAGAGFGAAMAILMSFGVLGIQVSSFLFGLLAVFLTYTIGRKVEKSNTNNFILILSGILVGTVFQSLISLTKYLADPYEKLPSITFWLMGSLARVTNNDILIVLIPFLIGIIPLIMIRWKINVLAFGDEEAKALGVDTTKTRLILIVASTLMTSSAVATCGLVGWVGLIIPHLARMLVGPDFRKLLPTTLLIGSVYFLMVDNIARSVVETEIPLGILTSLIGAPFFIYLLLNARKGWS